MKKHAKKIVVALLVIAMLVPTVAMIFTSAADNSYPVELAYNNLFVFDDWANNDLSTTIMPNVKDAKGNPLYGKVETNIQTGVVTISKYKDAPESYGGIFTAHSMDAVNTANNANYYTINVEPSTDYTFSYTLANATIAGFNTIVFYFDKDNKYIDLAAFGATTLSGKNSASFSTPANADHIQIRFTVANDGGSATTSVDVKDIIIYKNDVLTPGNLFSFNNWANNENSNGLASDFGLGNGTHNINTADESIYFSATGGTFTNFSITSSEDYYVMDVAPNTTYSISYSLLNSTLVSSGVALAWHKADGSLISTFNLYSYNSNGSNTHRITTPADTAYMQIAFGAFGAGSGTFKNIKVNRASNLFDLNGWATNPLSSALAPGLNNGSVVTSKKANQELTFNVNAAASNVIYTGFGVDAANPNTGFYTIDVKPSTEYTLSYNFDLNNFNIPGPIHLQPIIVELDSSNRCIRWQENVLPATILGSNSASITTQPNTARVMIVFSVHGDVNATAKSCTVRDIAFFASSFKDITGAPHREVFEYDHSAPDTYGDLPEATAPEGYVFGGWYTGENGTGERITPETKVKYESFSVFPKFEREVDSLEIATPANKLTYTKGEKFNPAGLTLRATSGSSSFIINSDIYCTPAYLNTVGEQTITAHYGGQTVTFKVNVLGKDQASVYINGTAKTVDVVNNGYVINASVDDFNYYTISYYSNAYVQGVITFETGSEEFFLEPSNNGSFSSLIDSYLDRASHHKIQSIVFTCLDNELGTFQLKDIKTEYRTVPNSSILTKSDNKHELGVDLKYGGVVTDLYSLNQSDPVTARVYDDPEGRWEYDAAGNALRQRDITLVDYASKLDAFEKANSSFKKTTDKNGDSSIDKVNLINTLDRGRYLQQSYYGTNQRPYVQGSFNRSAWRYNPVQGGNVGEEPSKVIDYQVTDTYIYVKTRAMQWEKWSDDHVAECTHYEWVLNDAGTELIKQKTHREGLYGDYDAVVSDTYMEAWYTFENGMIKVTNRKVDYSGLPEATTQQEMPALYLIEPLNHFVYNDVAEAWTSDNNFVKEEEPEFWGIVQDYHEFHYVTRDAEGNITKVTNDENGDNWYDLYVEPKEHWAAFAASDDADSFGVGIYSEASDDFYYGVMPQIYSELQHADGTFTQGNDLNYRHAETFKATEELATSYIAPLAERTFKSYDPTEYTYYLATGTVTEIDAKFNTINSTIAETELAKPKIAVPETVYLKPTDNGTSENPTDDIATVGQYYVNNILDENDFFNVKVVADAGSSMYFGLHVKDAVSFKVNVTNVTDPTNDVLFVDENGTSQENISINPNYNISTHIDESGLALKLSKGIVANTTVTAKWEITVTLSTGATETYVAYTVLYAPMRTVGAVAESRQNENTHNEISSWITGANGVDHQSFSPLGQWKGDIHDSGYFIFDPLYNNVPPENYGDTQNSHDYIHTDYPNFAKDPDLRDDKGEDAYVVQAATDGHDSSRAQSYLGLLTVDSSRYTNTNQIPNFKVGFDFLRVANNEKDSSRGYTTYYTLGDDSSFTAGVTDSGDNMGDKPSGWDKTVSNYGRGEVLPVPRRETDTPSYDVSEINGKYIHALGWAHLMPTGLGINQDKKWATAGTSVLCSVTDKSDLRDAVLNGYVQADKTDDPDFIEKLQNAATVLGNPSSSQPEIDEATKTLTEVAESLYYSLKYDNLFSAYEMSQFPESMKTNDEKASISYTNGSFTVYSNGTAGKDIFSKYGSSDVYYHIALKPSTEYVFEYDVTSDKGFQSYLFFYKADGSGTVVTNRTVQTDSGAPVSSSNTDSNGNPMPHFGSSGGATTGSHRIMRFTTPSDISEMGLRFGNINDTTVTSTFYNIRLIEAEKYYADAEYAKTEDVYKEYDAYGTLPTLTRPGYNFIGWEYSNGDEATAEDIATKHETIYSVWETIEYTITYNKNGGIVSPEKDKYTIVKPATIPNPSREGYIFKGWKVTEAEGSWTVDGICQAGDVTTNMYGDVTLTAQWVLAKFPVYFDTILDFSEWNTTTAGNATFSNVADNGFTLTSTATMINDKGETVPTGEGTSSSPYFAVEPGESYKIDIDITGNNWDVYIFFCNANGEWVDFQDSTNRYSSSGHGPADRIFTAPNKSEVVKAQIRVDANGASNSVTFSDIRVYEANSRAANVNVPYSNKEVEYSKSFGELPVPTREGYEFLGWYDGNTLITESSTVNQTSNVYLKSKWKITNDALKKDTVVIDFSTPIEIKPLENDIAYATAKTAEFLGFSADGTTPGTADITGKYGTFKVIGQTVTYTPSMAVDSVEKIWYHALIEDETGEHKIKNEITVAPASNVLYEETFFETANPDSTNKDWADSKATSGGLGTSTTVNQSPSDSNDIYGYDSNTQGYNKPVKYSNGTAKTVTVDENNRSSKNITFTFTGTGFDLNSACGANTGVMIVTLRDNSTNTITKSYLVDTYYDDVNYGDLTNSNTLYQVPIISERNLGNKNYTVQVVASYLPSMSGAVKSYNKAQQEQVLNPASVSANIAPAADSAELREALAEIGMDYILDAAEVEVIWFDDNSVLNGGEGANSLVAGDTLETASISLFNVIDSVRIYEPLTDDSYYINSEKGATYYNVIDNLLKTSSEGSNLIGSSFFAYITGKLGVDEEGNDIQLSVSNYNSVGPKDELYLAESTDAVAFKINNFAAIKRLGGRVMVSLRAASGTPNFKVGGKTDGTISAKKFEVMSNTAMYYDITNYIEPDGTVVFQNTRNLNTDKSLLAIGDLKITDSTNAVTASLSTDVDLMTVRAMMMAEAVEVEPNTTPTPEEPEEPEVPEVPEIPEDPNEPEVPEEPEEPANECWLVRIFRWIFGTCVKIFNIFKGFLGI